MCYTCLDEVNHVNAYAASFVDAIRSPELTDVALYVTDIGSPENIAMMCLVLAMVLWIHGKVRHMLQLIITVAAAAFISIMTKLIVQLPRPGGGLFFESGYSFASGHAMIATVFFLLIAYSYKPHIRSLAFRRAFVLLCVLSALLVGFSRIYLGVHYATDVAAGFLFGAMIFAFSILAFEHFERKRPVLQSRQ